MSSDEEIVRALGGSERFRAFARSWEEFTHMPLSLIQVRQKRAGETVACRGDVAVCQLVKSTPAGALICQRTLDRLCDGQTEVAMEECAFGLREVVVPIRVGSRTIAVLQTGRVLAQPATESGFRKLWRALGDASPGLDRANLRAAYFASPTAGKRHLGAAGDILTSFAAHLGAMSNRMMISAEHAEPLLLIKAKTLIADNLDQEWTLAEVAKKIGTTRFYLCRLFRRFVGVTFTEYRSRCRLERAKDLLLEPNRRICEVAYAAGFQSLTHFNRVFRHMEGVTPTAFRARTPPTAFSGTRFRHE